MRVLDALFKFIFSLTKIMHYFNLLLLEQAIKFSLFLPILSLLLLYLPCGHYQQRFFFITGLLYFYIALLLLAIFSFSVVNSS
jgi:hypothetical protein